MCTATRHIIPFMFFNFLKRSNQVFEFLEEKQSRITTCFVARCMHNFRPDVDKRGNTNLKHGPTYLERGQEHQSLRRISFFPLQQGFGSTNFLKANIEHKHSQSIIRLYKASMSLVLMRVVCCWNSGPTGPSKWKKTRPTNEPECKSRKGNA